jgi:hypothetical protein
MDYFGSRSIYKDIVISKGLHFNDQTDNLVIQKPGEEDDGAGKIVIPSGTYLTNLGTGRSSYTPAIPEDLNTFSLNRSNSSTNKTISNYYRNADNSKIGVSVGIK